MASNITLSYFGPPEQKHVVKVPPMQTLAEALQAAATKFKPALVPERCTLQYNKKAVDLHTPFRLLNVPAGSKLEVLIRAPQQPAAAAAGPNNPTTQPAASSTQVQQPAATAATAAGSAPAHAAAPPAQAPPAQQQAQPQQQPAPVPAVAQAGAGPSSSGAAAQPSPLAALGVEGQVFVFNQKALEAAAAAAQGPSPMQVDPPDDFFELTPDDLVRLQQQANQKKRQEALFKPRAMREAEEAARAASLGPVRVRLHFPDATIVQATFTASQPLSAVQQLVKQLALPAVAPALYLYTTPPKKVLKDPTATLYQLQLVPAAHLYVGCDPSKLKSPAAAAPAAPTAAAGGSHPGPFLKPEVLRLMQDSLPEQQQEPEDAVGSAQQAAEQQEASTADAQRVLAAAAAASRAQAGPGSSSSRGAAGGDGGAPKVPKWLKMGK